ncbi:MAG TPA: FdhC protein, partial [Erysipelotrichaceae bacterium]|nr:FdhC protein [Erysipelotrichaceae bacterium]
MNTNQYLTPEEITEVTIQVGIKKTKASALNLFILGILAGVFIAFASEG